MGKNAKVHKRLKKKTASHTVSGPSAISNSHPRVQAAKQKAGLKYKTKNRGAGNEEGGLLGGVDYVSMMMGGRRKAKQEAAKMPGASDK